MRITIVYVFDSTISTIVVLYSRAVPYQSDAKKKVIRSKTKVVIDSMPTEKADFGFWGNRHLNRPTLK